MSLASMKEHKLLKEQVETLTEEQDELREEIASLEDTKDNLENEVENHQGDMDCQAKAYEEKIEKLKEEIDGDTFLGIKEGLKKEKSNLILQHKAIVKEVSRHRIALGHSDEQINKLKDEIEELKTSLQTTTSYHTDKYELLKAENVKLQEKVDDLGDKLDDTDDDKLIDILGCEHCDRVEAVKKLTAEKATVQKLYDDLISIDAEDHTFLRNENKKLTANAVEIEKLKAEMNDIVSVFDGNTSMKKMKEENEELKAELLKTHKKYDYQRTAWDKEREFQKEVSTQRQGDLDAEHVRFLDEQQKRGDDLCLISQALGIDYHGENDDIFKAIKKLKEEIEKIKADKITEFLRLLDSMAELERDNEKLKEEIDDAPEMRYTGEEMEKMVAVMECMDEHPDYDDMCDDYQKEIDFLRKENKQKTRLLRKAREAKTI